MVRQKAKRKFLHRDMTKPEKRIGFILLISLCFSFYFVIPFARVSTIRVVGNVDVTTEQIKSSSGIVTNQLVLPIMLDTSSIQTTLTQQYIRIETVDIQVVDINVIQLTIKEKATVAYIELGDKYYTVLSNGSILEESNRQYIGSVPIVKWDDTIQSLEIMAKELAKIDTTTRQSISEITHQQQDKLLTTLFMSDGNQVKVHYTSFAEKMEYYNHMKKILQSKKGVIDLTVGAYFVPYK